MNPVELATGSISGVAPTGGNDMAALDSQDFFRLLISEITNQDPFEPTDNQTLLNQISSIREIELSSSLTESLQKLTGQQNFASTSSLIGKFITSLENGNTSPLSGVVVGVRFDGNGQAILQLGTGGEVPMQQLASVQSVDAAAEALVGQLIVAVDRENQGDSGLVDGQVTRVQRGDDGGVQLELDDGAVVRLQDVIGVTQAAL